MFCPNCGKELNENSKFCIYCGFEISANNDEIYSHSYYKDSYKKKPANKKSDSNSLGGNFIKGVVSMLVLILGIFGFLILKNYLSGDLLSFDKMKYQQYIENPSLIPELTQPENLIGFINNLKDVQNFLELYLKVSDDDMETKLNTFDKYRKELLKMQNLDNTNLLDANVKFQIPRTQKEFNKTKKEYDKLLSKVGLTIAADESYTKYHLVEDNVYTYKRYGKYLPSDINDYLNLRAKHSKQCIHKDELIIKPYSLAQRIGDYEKFYNSHKEFRYIDEVKDLLFTYSFVYSFTSDRTNANNLNRKTFQKSDKKFIKKYPLSELKPLFQKLSTSANGISEKQFDEMYPYEYQKGLDAIKPNKEDLSDIFTTVRKGIINLKSDNNFEYMYISSTNTWAKYNPETPLKKGDIILALTNDGYEIFDYKYKKTNQTIQPEKNSKFFIKENQLFVYSPKNLQIQSLENSYGSFSFRTLSVRAIKKIFPDILIINIDTFGEFSVQIDKPAGTKTYMLISTSGGNYDDYRLSGDIEIGELSNIFTISSDSVQVDWTPNSDGDCYHMYFITQPSAQQSSENIKDSE